MKKAQFAFKKQVIIPKNPLKGDKFTLLNSCFANLTGFILLNTDKFNKENI